jgi:hypothetical protein
VRITPISLKASIISFCFAAKSAGKPIERHSSKSIPAGFKNVGILYGEKEDVKDKDGNVTVYLAEET